MMRFKAEMIEQDHLTPREGRILELMCEARTDKVIARDLGITSGTVHAHIENIYLKMGIREASINVRCAAIVTAIVQGIVKMTATTQST